jgi:hypothetical protein
MLKLLKWILSLPSVHSTDDLHIGLFMTGDGEILPISTTTEREDMLHIKGEFNSRVSKMLGRFGNRYELPKDSPLYNCHSVAWHVTGLSRLEYMSVEDLGKTYQRLKIRPSRTPLTASPNKPILTHLTPEEVPEDYSLEQVFTSIKRHTVVLVGNLEGKPLCFEKRGIMEARFACFEEVRTLFSHYHGGCEAVYVNPRDVAKALKAENN